MSRIDAAFPLGATPRLYWELRTIEERISELLRARIRYQSAGVSPLPEWATEVEELRARYRELEQATPLGMPSEAAGVPERDAHAAS